MTEGIIAAISAIAVGIISAVSNVLIANATQKKTNEFTDYRIGELKDQVKNLEAKQDKHNQVIERTFRLEEHTAVLDEKIKVANHRIDDLESKTK